ncbi:MAG: DUF916 and DUF3324 domain-containing protein [Bombilactobacillus mellifer]|uniref:WxL protein host-binding domain-containing protein n=1 Tax=Bombilactobacillus mellifer TaxID=1218492 RepID=UPI0023F6C265|nr:DUF3324 domain-containing protein [Bombilactobacillus mellifer]MCT6895161.1 DUF916 and DUF3324 domain-containing protein [Bombilactobacillus mellifer]
MLVMKKLQMNLIVALISMIGWCFFYQIEITHAAAGMPVAAQLTVPANNKTNQPILDVDVQPQTVVHFGIKLQNLTSHPLQVQLLPGVAQTDSTGNINLVSLKDARKNMDSSWKYNVQQLGLSVQKVRLQSKQKLVVPLSLTAPKYRGTIAGAVIVQYIPPKAKHGTSNQLQFASELLLNVGDYTPIVPQIKLGAISLQAGGTPQVIAPVHNQRPVYYGGRAVSYRAQIYRADRRMLHKLNLPNASLAANSICNLSIPWGNQAVHPGRYLLKLRVQAGEQTWHLQRWFNVSFAQARQLNQANPNLQRNPWIFRILIIGVFILFLIVFLTLVFVYAKHKGLKSRKNN